MRSYAGKKRPRRAPRGAFVGLAVAAVALAGGLAPVGADPYRPPAKRAFFGVSDTGEVRQFREFAEEVDAHPAVMQTFHTWGYHPWQAMDRWARTSTRGMLSISTTDAYAGEEVLSPKAIALGWGDEYPLTLNRRFADEDETVYIRLLPEMNGHWNPYSAFDADGTSRGPSHSTRWFRKAWRRFTLIVRGGKRERINKRLRRQGMPRIMRAEGREDYRAQDVDRRLPRADVALLWVPQTHGSPNLRANRPRAYWPGKHYVDWVGADIYAKFPNFDWLSDFYRDWKHRPFLVGEWSPWDRDDPDFVKRLFGWAKRHERTRLLVYFQDFGETNPHHIDRYPAARQALRRRLNKPRFPEYAPGSVRPPPGEEPPEGEPPEDDPLLPEPRAARRAQPALAPAWTGGPPPRVFRASSTK